MSDKVFTEGSINARIAIITHMARFGGQKEAATIAKLSGDDNWRIRARAAKCLAWMAPLSLPVLKDAVNSDTENIRIAALQALHTTGIQIR
ncbi:MAG: HEAT repeat domain-containing protein [Desulfobacterales bacterium]